MAIGGGNKILDVAVNSIIMDRVDWLMCEVYDMMSTESIIAQGYQAQLRVVSRGCHQQYQIP